MSGSNAFPFKKLNQYIDKPYPGHLPVKSHPTTSAEMDAATNIKFMVAPYKKTPDETDSGAPSNEVFDRIDKIRNAYPETFAKYIMQNTSYDEITRWLANKQIQLEADKSTKRNELSKNIKSWESNIFSLEKLLNEGLVGQYEAMYRVFPILQDMTYSDGFKIFLVSGIGNRILYFRPGLLPMGLRDRTTTGASERPMHGQSQITMKTNVAAHVAFTVQPVLVEDVDLDRRFPDGALSDEDGIVSVMCVPVLLANKELVAVAEFYRKKTNFPYSTTSLNHVMAVLEWVSNTIYRSKTARGIDQLSQMSSFLLKTTEKDLTSNVDGDELIKAIMRFAKSSILADRCSFLLYDEKANELELSLFDTGNDADGNPVFDKRKPIRIAADAGIAGFVATNRVVLNITDPYNDSRFNKDVDKRTGYITRSILAAPILSEGKLFGVVQLLNKVGGAFFSNTDQKSFEMFTVYCSLAIRFMKMGMTMLNEKHKLDILTENHHYRLRVKPKTFNDFASIVPKKMKKWMPPDFQNFLFNLRGSSDEDMMLFFYYMVKSAVDKTRLPSDDRIIRFIISVREGYRDIEYHNFYHAMTFTHCCYCFIKKHPHLFPNPVEVLSLLIASVTHDIDHRGFGNGFMYEGGTPIGQLYGQTSTMEEHHYAMACEILARPECNMLEGLSGEELDEAYDTIRETIIATDLLRFFPSNAKLQLLLSSARFNEKNRHHAKIRNTIMATACDLSLMIKDWESVKEQVYLLYEEFWHEGDLRKQKEMGCIEMMDRNYADRVPDGQIGFYSFVLSKCFATTSIAYPDSLPLEQGCKRNLSNWKKEKQRLIDEKVAEKARLKEEEKMRRLELERMQELKRLENQPKRGSSESESSEQLVTR